MYSFAHALRWSTPRDRARLEIGRPAFEFGFRRARALSGCAEKRYPERPCGPAHTTNRTRLNYPREINSMLETGATAGPRPRGTAAPP